MPPHQADRPLRSQRGQALVEFVLVLPLVLVILFGILDFSLALNYQSDLNHITAEGARRAAVNQDDTFDPATYTKDAAEPSIRDDVAVSVCLPDGSQPGDTVRIKATHEYSLLRLVPGLSELTTIDISGRAAMRLEAPATFSGSSTSGPCD